MARLVTGRWPSSSSRYSTIERVLASRFRPLRRTSLGLPVLPEVVSRRASSGWSSGPCPPGRRSRALSSTSSAGTKPSSTRPVSAGRSPGTWTKAGRCNVGVQQQGHFSRF